jgi:mono/diheme cytochrome c family protein/sRNA-binding regulator protein Hfq
MWVSTGMKKFRDVAILASLIGCLVFYCAQAPIQAASEVNARAQAAQPAGNSTQDSPGSKSYSTNCAICHGDKREGILPAFPPLVGVQHHLTDLQISEIVQKGKDRMPGFPDIKGEELAGLLHYLDSGDESAGSAASGAKGSTGQTAASEAGGVLFQQSCAFCHGRDTLGGESGPDLSRSKIVIADVNGDKISQVVREGRPEKKMPAFNFSAPELQNLAAFIHAQAAIAATHSGDRRGVDVSDLQTGNAAAGKQYFDGAGGCVQCHSATGDLAGVAKRFEGLELEQRMLYPRGAKSKVTVTLSSGQQMNGTLAYLDEFVVGLRDGKGTYHSWQISKVKYDVKSPVEAHVNQFSKYTDADIHNLMAYLQTLR